MDIPLWTGEVLTGQELAALDADETLAQHVLARAGLELVEGVAQVWKLAESELHVRAERAADGRWRVLVAGHDAPAPLAVVYAAAVSGEFRWLGAGTFPRWKRRALLEAGLVGMPDVTLANLPDDASESTRLLWNAIQLLVRVRMLGGERAADALPLSRPFLRHWTPASERGTRTGMETLERLGLIWRVGSYTKSSGRRPLTLWGVRLSDERAAG
jgi:hypothetical protein